MNNLEKEFVPYAEALELKELGFDEPCMGKYYWHNKELPIYMQWNKAEDYNSVLLPTACLKDKISPFISAPTFSQAFRWFREKYGLNHEITSAGKEKKYHAFTCGDYIYGGNGIFASVFTYEEAELACLRKLIEIVKENK
jgi:hypothetical protein